MLSIFLTILVVVNGQGCLKANNIEGLPPPFIDYSCSDNYADDDDDVDDDCRRSDTIPELHQVIIPSYRFTCCGNITEWEVDVHPGGYTHDRVYTLNLQVWRPSPTVQTTDCYSLVENNRFTSVSLTNQLVMVTPQPQERIEFQPGDVLGFSLENTEGNDGGVVLLRDSEEQGDNGYETEEVWYANISNTVPDNSPGVHPYPASRSLSTSIRAAPVISASYNITSCPTKVLPATSSTSASLHQLTKLCVKSSAPIRTARISLHSNVKTSKSFLTTQTTETPHTTTSNPNMNMKSNGVLPRATIAGLVVILIIVLTMVALLVIMCSIKVKKSHSNSNEVPVVNNEAYAIGTHGSNAPNYPEVMANQTMSIDTRQNEAYATCTEIKQSVAYTMNITMDSNAAYNGSGSQDIGTESGVYEYVF